MIRMLLIEAIRQNNFGYGVYGDNYGEEKANLGVFVIIHNELRKYID